MSSSPTDYPIRACAWPPRPPRPDTVRMITAEELRTWILFEDERLLVVNKPGDVVCHPSKAGPWSSLVGAVREYCGLPTVHLVFRLDRETSGVVVLAKQAQWASRLQRAVQDRRVGKRYLAVLTGHLPEAVWVEQPLGPDTASPVFVKSTVRPDGQSARTRLQPLWAANGFTLAAVQLDTGRKHQIRAHAQWLKYPVVGDKIYGPDARLYLEFIDHGFTASLAEQLLLPRHALHCAEIRLGCVELPPVLRAPLAADLREFLSVRFGADIDADGLLARIEMV